MIALILIVAALLRGEFKWVKARGFMGYCIKKQMDLFFLGCMHSKRHSSILTTKCIDINWLDGIYNKGVSIWTN